MSPFPAHVPKSVKIRQSINLHSLICTLTLPLDESTLLRTVAANVDGSSPVLNFYSSSIELIHSQEQKFTEDYLITEETS